MIIQAEEMLKIPESAISQMYHIAAFKLWKPKTHFEKGVFIISIDIDVGSKELGIRNQGKNDANIHRILSEYAVGKIEEMALPLFMDVFETYAVPATFAVRGQCLDVNPKCVERIKDSTVKHSIGSHGYSHRKFEDLSCSEAEMELNMISIAMRRSGIVPRSFIFPRNSVAHLDLLEKYGYKAYRCDGNFLQDRMQIVKQGGLYNICPSIHLTRSVNALFLKRIVDVAIVERAPLHLWSHLWNFGKNLESIQRNINSTVIPLLKYAREKANLGVLTFETMLSTIERIERSEKMKETTENT